MATVTGLTAAHMQALADANIVEARLEGDNLILTTRGGTDINVGVVKGASGTGGAGPANVLTIGTVTQGTLAASITGTSPSQVLNLVLPNATLPTDIAREVFQAAGGTWPAALAGASTRQIWIGYPGRSDTPATTGRPEAVAGLDSYEMRV